MVIEDAIEAVCTESSFILQRLKQLSKHVIK